MLSIHEKITPELCKLFVFAQSEIENKNKNKIMGG
jgi:hypothetical protein